LEILCIVCEVYIVLKFLSSLDCVPSEVYIVLKFLSSLVCAPSEVYIVLKFLSSLDCVPSEVYIVLKFLSSLVCVASEVYIILKFLSSLVCVASEGYTVSAIFHCPLYLLQESEAYRILTSTGTVTSLGNTVAALDDRNVGVQFQTQKIKNICSFSFARV
jgi:hypothetical protein